MIAEVLRALNPMPGETVLDCTVGAGGHTSELLSRVLPGGRVIGLDRDAEQIGRTSERLAEFGEALSLHVASFAWAGSYAPEDGRVFDVILADLGVSSMQIDDPTRGFSYKTDGPLDMRMDRSTGRTAQQLLASIDPSELADALRDLADEPDADKVAKAIGAARLRRPLRRTGELTRLVLEAKGWTAATWKERAKVFDSGPHPAARTFQALRILVNDEMGALERLLQDAPLLLGPGGRIAVMSFHSGEDRRVKHAFRDGMRSGLYEAVAEEPIRAGAPELRSNPRAASARLRWAVRTR
jgi:16S rRNA (cytosine1402-N4)-methyltransferase